MTGIVPAQDPSPTQPRHTLATGHIPFLPPEVHLVLVQHVHRRDLSNYRLANRLLNEIGKTELFKTFILRNTRASASRFKHVLGDQQLSRLVQTLIWDVNAWRVGPNVRDWHEWTRHCESQASIVEPDQAALYRELAESRQHWEAYLSRLKDEKAAIKEIMILITNHGGSVQPEGSFAELQLPNLQKVYILKNFAFRLRNARVYRRTGNSIQGKKLPVVRPLSAWRGDSLQNTMSQALLSAIFAVAVSVRKLRFDGLTIQDHTQLWAHTMQKPLKLTSLRIRCCASSSLRAASTHSAVLHSLFTLLPDLESLNIDLRARYRSARTGPGRATLTVQDTFGVDEASANGMSVTGALVMWPKLRKLSLSSFDASPAALVSLVARHSSALRYLRLQAMYLDDTGEKGSIGPHSWQDIFAAIGKPPILEKASLGGLSRGYKLTDGSLDVEFVEPAHAAGDWVVNVLNLPQGKHCSKELCHVCTLARSYTQFGYSKHDGGQTREDIVKGSARR